MMGEPAAVQQATALDDLVVADLSTDQGRGWLLRNSACLEVRLDGDEVMIKVGSVVANRGDLKFRQATPHGLGRWLKKTLASQSRTMTRVTGSGVLYCADQGKDITILSLHGRKLVVSSSNCLAFSGALEWDARAARGSGKETGRTFNVSLAGTGHCAISTHGKPVVLPVSPGSPLLCDPNATVAWSPELEVSTSIDIGWYTLIGGSRKRSSQLRFDGTGFVVVEAFKEAQAPVAAAGQLP